LTSVDFAPEVLASRGLSRDLAAVPGAAIGAFIDHRQGWKTPRGTFWWCTASVYADVRVCLGRDLWNILCSVSCEHVAMCYCILLGHFNCVCRTCIQFLCSVSCCFGFVSTDY